MASRSTDIRFFALVTIVTRRSTRQILVRIYGAEQTLSTTKPIFCLELPSRTSSASVCSSIHIFSGRTCGDNTTPTNATFIIGGTFSILVLMTPSITLSHFGVDSACVTNTVRPWKASVGAVLIFTAIVAFADIALGDDRVAVHAVSRWQREREERSKRSKPQKNDNKITTVHH